MIQPVIPIQTKILAWIVSLQMLAETILVRNYQRGIELLALANHGALTDQQAHTKSRLNLPRRAGSRRIRLRIGQSISHCCYRTHIKASTLSRHSSKVS